MKLQSSFRLMRKREHLLQSYHSKWQYKICFSHQPICNPTLICTRLQGFSALIKLHIPQCGLHTPSNSNQVKLYIPCSITLSHSDHKSLYRINILYNHIPCHYILHGILKELNVFHGFRYLLDSEHGKVFLDCCNHFFS